MAKRGSSFCRCSTFNPASSCSICGCQSWMGGHFTRSWRATEATVHPRHLSYGVRSRGRDRVAEVAAKASRDGHIAPSRSLDVRGLKNEHEDLREYDLTRLPR